MFLKFSIFYGHIWRSQFKNEHYSNLARDEWRQALVSFDAPVVDEAIAEVLKHREFPPTLSQFIDCCKQLSNKNKGFYSSEMIEVAKPSVAEENLRKMRLILNMKIK